MSKVNRIINVDSYKPSHYLQLPDGAERAHVYIESRGGKFSKTLFAGLQPFLKEYFAEPITLEEIQEAKELITAHGEPFNEEGWMYILTEYGGRIPLEINAVPEGTLVPTSNALVTLENQDPKLAWLPAYFADTILRAVWGPTQVATTSYMIKQVILRYLRETGTPELIDFKLHDFGSRGTTSAESAALMGLGHLFNFMGTDTMLALVAARKYYNTPMAGFSIPASEHSTMTMLGKEGESKQFKRMVETFGGEGKNYACVSDGFDILNAVKNIWGDELKDLVIGKGGTLVVRPDSGDPVRVTLKVAQLLGETFGYSLNTKGFKVLHPSVRIIQGDGVNIDSITAILENFKKFGWSADNIAFGMGGALLQNHTRDDNRWAAKCSAVQINGRWHDVFKQPMGDATKVSKKGRLVLTKDFAGNFKTERLGECLNPQQAFHRAYLNGEVLLNDDLATIRKRVSEQK